MSDYTANQPATTQATVNGAASRSRRNTRMLVGALTISGVALAGAGVALVMAFTSPSAAHTAAPAAPSAPSAPVDPYTPPVSPAVPVAPVQPSAYITTLQQQLGQLNYYEGPVNGVMDSQVTQSITYLQRDANLPQTGEMDSATTAALASMLVTGNNHMGG